MRRIRQINFVGGEYLRIKEFTRDTISFNLTPQEVKSELCSLSLFCLGTGSVEFPDRYINCHCALWEKGHCQRKFPLRILSLGGGGGRRGESFGYMALLRVVFKVVRGTRIPV